MEHVCEPVADCRICLESADHSEGRPLVVPCECAGTCKYVHRDCLEHWVLERGSSSCEVCKAPYKEEALTELGLRRLEEQRRRELEWPQHDADFGDEAMMMHRRAAPATQRLIFLSTLSMLAVVFFLAQDEDPIVPADPEEALLQLIDASGCTSEEGRASSTRTCDLAEKVLRHIRLTREATREQYAEQEAGEAMGRLTRAFILLCILRIVIAQQQRRRILLERQLAWERREAAHGRLPV